ncbi:MAG: HAD family phosphatase [Proteobacteria bacterium]|nr:HAD family phosphatase [Pseudomonadota bacterium]
MSSQIRNIVFDIGKVVLDFDHFQFIRNLKAHNLDLQVESFAKDLRLIEFEHGEISNQEFVNFIKEKIGKEVPDEIITTSWQKIFKPFPEMFQLISKLRPNYKVFLLSNTNDLHMQYMIETYDFPNLVDDYIASSEVKAMKPSPLIYKAAEKKFNISGHETIFIDDIKENIEGAIAAGWRGIAHSNPETTIGEFLTLGIKF